jgi:sugar lactone lactonase YvrE
VAPFQQAKFEGNNTKMKLKTPSIRTICPQPSRNLGIAFLIACSASGIPIENVSGDAPAVQSGSPPARAGAIIRTVAGGRAPTGNARSSIYGTSSVVARGRAVYLSDFNTSSIYRLGPGGDVIRIAGSGVAGFAGDGGSATKALLGPSLRLAFDDSGDLYFADADNNRIRRVDAASGVITTVAGNGSASFGGDEGPATRAALNVPAGVAWRSGNLFIADRSNCVIRKVDANGIITTVAGVPNNCSFGGDGGPAESALLSSPLAVTFDRDGNLLITDSVNNRIRSVDAASGVITTVAGNGVAGFSGDGGPATAAQLIGPSDVAVDEKGDLYIADTGNVRIRRVDHATNIISTLAGTGVNGFGGDGGPAVTSEMAIPLSVSLDGAKNLYIADFGNGRVRRIASSTAIITTAAGGANVTGRIDAADAELGFTPNPPASPFPNGLAIDPSGNLMIDDTDSNRVWRVNGDAGIISLAAGSGIGAFGFSGDGHDALRAKFALPGDVAVDRSGNVFIADTQNERIRRVDAETRMTTTVAGNGAAGFSGDGGPAALATLISPSGLSVDRRGNLFIADMFNQRIRRVDAVTGFIETVAGNGTGGFGGDGGPAVSAQLSVPSGAVTDANGNLFIADAGNNRIREVVAATGVIRTVAGSGVPGACLFGGDGGPATSAQLCNPARVVVDALGNLFIADQGNNRVRRVDAASGVISTVAGNGRAGFSGDGGPALAATLDAPFALSLDPCGNLFIADAGSGRVREIVFSQRPPDRSAACFASDPVGAR